MRKAGESGQKSVFRDLGLQLLLAVAAILLLANLAVRFSSVSIWDDAYFFARYADNWIAQGHFSWNPNSAGSYGLTSLAYGFFVVLESLLGIAAPAGLWWGSLFFGLLAIFAVILTYFRAETASGTRPGAKWAMLAAAIALAAVPLSMHFSSGMDTTLAMAWMAIYLLAQQRLGRRLSPGKALLLGVIGGSAWMVRPDLLIFPMALALGKWLLSRQGLHRQMVGYLLLFTVATILACMVICLQLFGSLVPLSFFAKSFGTQDPGITAAYAWKGIQHGLFFLGISLPFWMGIWNHRPSKAEIKHFPVEISLLAGFALFWLYQSLLVTPVMGYGARFLFPTWPLLAYLALNALKRDPRKAMPAWLDKRSSLILLAFGLLAFGMAWTWLAKPANLSRHLGKMSLSSAYFELGRNNWPNLEEVLALEGNVKIASTELGILGMMAKDREVIDLVGLHDSHLAMKGFDPLRLCNLQAPDLVYLPHPDYKALNEKLLAAPCFQENYEIFDAEKLHAFMGMAIRRNSEYFLPLKHIILAAIDVEEKKSGNP